MLLSHWDRLSASRTNVRANLAAFQPSISGCSAVVGGARWKRRCRDQRRRAGDHVIDPSLI
jgi:hypothetical protein